MAVVTGERATGPFDSDRVLIKLPIQNESLPEIALPFAYPPAFNNWGSVNFTVIANFLVPTPERENQNLCRSQKDLQDGN